MKTIIKYYYYYSYFCNDDDEDRPQIMCCNLISKSLKRIKQITKFYDQTKKKVRRCVAVRLLGRVVMEHLLDSMTSTSIFRFKIPMIFNEIS